MNATPFHPRTGVRGWLLVLCLMLVVVGPLLSAWLMAHTYGVLAPQASNPASVRFALVVSLILSTASVLYGMHAGLALWRVRPGAVATTRNALFFGLAVDIVATAIDVATLSAGPAGSMLGRVEVKLIPSLVFFTLCIAYLNRSARVRATYPAPGGLRSSP